MPYLARSSRLQVSNLDLRPPDDLRQVHAVLESGIRDTEVKLQLIEKSYYSVSGGIDNVTVHRQSGRPQANVAHRDPVETEVSHWAAAIRPMLSAAGVTAFLSVEQVNDAAHRKDMDADILNELFTKVAAPSYPAAVDNRQPKTESGVNKSDDAPATVDEHVRTEVERSGKMKAEDTGQESATNKDSAEIDNHSVHSAFEEDDAVDVANSAALSQTQSKLSATAAAAAATVKPETAPDADDDTLFSLSRTLRVCVRKVLDAVPSRFDDVINDVRLIQRHMRKYCVSFYADAVGDTQNTVGLHGTRVRSSPLLGTAATYDVQIQQRLRSIDSNLASIKQQVDRFRQQELRLVDFGSFGVDLARRTGAAHAPFLLLFPFACNQIRLALEEMRFWLRDDASYADFVANDVADLESQTEALDAELRTLRQNYHKVTFKVRQAADQCDRLANELERTRAREHQLIVDEEMLTTETGDLKTELETAEYRRNEMTRNSALYLPDMMYAKYNELSERLREIKARLPIAEQALKDVRQKLSRLTEKRQRLKADLKSLASLEAERDSKADSLVELEVERDACALALESARLILTCKRSPDVIRKLFYDRPAHVTNAQRLPGHSSGQDSFDRLCHVVAEQIDRDWPILYRMLPFVPPRGLTTIDGDVAEIGSTRDAAVTSAERALSRWRRHHTAACPADLLSTLRRLNKSDVAKRVETEMTRLRAGRATHRIAAGAQDNVGASTLPDVPDWIEPELVPYWKEVEKFDQIRMTRKAAAAAAANNNVVERSGTLKNGGSPAVNFKANAAD